MHAPEREETAGVAIAAGAPDFERHRRHLTGLAYRMLGSVAEADDVVQDAWLRWHEVERDRIDNPKAYLTTVVTRLAIDRAKSAQRRRETYVGPWLPEPLAEASPHAAGREDDVAHDVSFALMLALERLSPLERAAFLLHDVFDAGFDESRPPWTGARRHAANSHAARVPGYGPSDRASRSTRTKARRSPRPFWPARLADRRARR